MKFSFDETRDFPGSRVSAENVTLMYDISSNS